MPYSALLALHLLAVATFAGGLLVVAFALPAFGQSAASHQLPELRRLRRLSNFVVTSALLAVWLLGAMLVAKGGWLPAHWLHAKIMLVVGLSALHGYQSGQLRRLASGKILSRAYPRWMPLLILTIIVVIVVLATAKPF